MKIYKENAASITIAGQTFSADGDGIIDVPGHLVNNAFSQGFVSAKARIRPLQAAANVPARAHLKQELTPKPDVNEATPELAKPKK